MRRTQLTRVVPTELFPKRLGYAVLATAIMAAACESEPPPPPSDPELRAELGIADNVRIHRIDLSGRGSLTRVLPPEVTILRGDIVQFVVLDRRIHTIDFDTDRIADDAERWLEESGQSSPPPLVEEGARLVLSFTDAPVGRYPFRVTGNGAETEGAIVVVDEETE